MDWRTYKHVCEGPDCFSRWALEKSLFLLNGSLGLVDVELKKILKGMPFEKPLDHKAGPETDFFKVNLDDGMVSDLIRQIESALDTMNSATRETRLCRHLVLVWKEYLRSLTFVAG